MTKLILAAIAGVGSICALVLWLFKRYGSKESEIRRLKKEVRTIGKKRLQAVRDGDMALVDTCDFTIRMLNAEIRSLRGK